MYSTSIRLLCCNALCAGNKPRGLQERAAFGRRFRSSALSSLPLPTREPIEEVFARQSRSTQVALNHPNRHFIVHRDHDRAQRIRPRHRQMRAFLSLADESVMLEETSELLAVNRREPRNHYR